MYVKNWHSLVFINLVLNKPLSFSYNLEFFPTDLHKSVAAIVPKTPHLQNLLQPVDKSLVSVFGSVYSFSRIKEVLPLVVVLQVLLVLKVGTGSHETVEGTVPAHDLALILNSLVLLNGLLELLGSSRVLILGSQAEVGDLELLSIGRVEHSGMNLRCSDKLVSGTEESNDLSSPAVSNESPTFNAGVGSFELRDESADGVDVFSGVGRTAEERAESGLLLGSVGRVVLDIHGLSEEEIGDDDESRGRRCDDVDSLLGLGEVESEDVINHQNSGLGVSVSGDICAHAIEGGESAGALEVILRDDGGYGAASFGGHCDVS